MKGAASTFLAVFLLGVVSIPLLKTKTVGVYFRPNARGLLTISGQLDFSENKKVPPQEQKKENSVRHPDPPLAEKDPVSSL